MGVGCRRVSAVCHIELRAARKFHLGSSFTASGSSRVTQIPGPGPTKESGLEEGGRRARELRRENERESEGR
jgi:hypothetical protein